jgi:hypothetical protein
MQFEAVNSGRNYLRHVHGDKTRII